MENSILLYSSKSTEKRDIGKKLSDFEILQVLGEGSYGFVAKVQSKLDFRIYALKKYDLSNINNEDDKKYILNERIFMKKLNHENVVKLYYDFNESGSLYLIMEYMDGGDLYTFIDAHRNLNIHIDEEKLEKLNLVILMFLQLLIQIKQEILQKIKMKKNF